MYKNTKTYNKINVKLKTYVLHVLTCPFYSSVSYVFEN